MDTLAKETMGLPIFICPTNNHVVSSGNTTTTSPTSTARTSTLSPPTSPTTVQTSPTTSFFATATPTRSSTSQTFFPASPLPQTSSSTTTRDTRRNTYTPPTFSPDLRRSSLLSPRRLSQAFDFASAFAVDVLSKAADQVFGNESTAEAATTQGQIWGEQDLEAGDGQREKEKAKGRYARFGEEGAFESWLD